MSGRTPNSLTPGIKQQGRAWPWLLASVVVAMVGWWYFAPDTLPTMVRNTMPLSPLADQRAPTLYKWRDDKGRLHVTDVAPTGRPYETVRYDPKTNVVPAYTAPQKPDTPPP